MAKVVVDTYGTGPLQQLFITTFKKHFTKMVVTRGGWLQECFQGDLPFHSFKLKPPHVRIADLFLNDFGSRLVSKPCCLRRNESPQSLFMKSTCDMQTLAYLTSLDI